MDYKIRTITEEEINLLQDFLYEAIFVPEGLPAPPRAVINHPELQVYLSDFGKQKDDYGHIDDDTPSLAISLYRDYRGLGIGTALMKEMLRVLKDKGYGQVSLSVQKANYAVKMYRKTGFEVMRENEEEYIMLCRF